MITKINERITPYRNTLLEHPLYSEIKTPAHLRLFMQHHVFAVWDFMSLLKALQNGLTCTEVPWRPVGDPETRYLINEIVLAEETDINRQGARQSHFEMYLDAMQKAGANSSQIEDFMKRTQNGTDILSLVDTEAVPAAIKTFLRFTFETIKEGKMHKIAAAFTFGREDLIPQMFTAIIKNIQQNFPEEDLADFTYYFDRHITLDEDDHGPMALKMVAQLCGEDGKKWREVEETVHKSLKAREALWEGVLTQILESN